MKRYDIAVAGSAESKLLTLPPSVEQQMRGRLLELAERVDGGGTHDDGFFRFEVAGFVVRYVIDDRRHVLLVTSIERVPERPGRARPPQLPN